MLPRILETEVMDTVEEAVDYDAMDQLVDTYAGDANDHQRKLFADSLHAALTLDEMRALVAEFAAPETVCATSDRHWTWAARKP